MSDFKIGDTVRLKSGGPLMTVDKVSDKGISCTWFKDKELEYAAFTPATLKADSGSF